MNCGAFYLTKRRGKSDLGGSGLFEPDYIGDGQGEHEAVLTGFCEDFVANCLEDRLLVGANAGREAAAKEMEAALGRLGLPMCRVLPFRRRLTAP